MVFKESGVNMNSTLIKDQKIKKVHYYTEDGTAYRITATIRHDDNHFMRVPFRT